MCFDRHEFQILPSGTERQYKAVGDGIKWWNHFGKFWQLHSYWTACETDSQLTWSQQEVGLEQRLLYMLTYMRMPTNLRDGTHFDNLLAAPPIAKKRSVWANAFWVHECYFNSLMNTRMRPTKALSLPSRWEDWHLGHFLRVHSLPSYEWFVNRVVWLGAWSGDNLTYWHGRPPGVCANFTRCSN